MIQRSFVSVILMGCTIQGSYSHNKGEDNLIYNYDLVTGTWTVEQVEKKLEKVILWGLNIQVEWILEILMLHQFIWFVHNTSVLFQFQSNTDTVAAVFLIIITLFALLRLNFDVS